MAQGSQKPMIGGITISQLPHPKLGESRRLHGVKSRWTSEPCSVWTCACGCDVKLVGVDKGAIERIQKFGAARFYADNHATPNADKGVTFLAKYDPDYHAYAADPADSTKTGVQAKGTSGHVTEGVPVRKEPAGEKSRWAKAAQKLYDEGKVHVGVDYAADRDVGQKSFEFFQFDPEVSPTGRNVDAYKPALQSLPPRSMTWREMYAALPSYGHAWPDLVSADASPFARHAESMEELRQRITARLIYGPERGAHVFTRKDLEHVNTSLRDTVGLPTFSGAIRDALARMRQSLPAGIPWTALKLQLSLDEKNWVDANDALIQTRDGEHPLGYRFARLAVVPPRYPERVEMDLQLDENGDIKTVVSDTHYGEGSAAIAAALGFGK